MLEKMDGLPEGVIGFAAHGKILAKDYEEVLTPALEVAIAEFGKIGFVYYFAKDFEGISAGAAYDDLMLDIKHFRDFRKIAVVTDNSVLGGITRACSFMVPCPLKVFACEQLTEACEWMNED